MTKDDAPASLRDVLKRLGSGKYYIKGHGPSVNRVDTSGLF